MSENLYAPPAAPVVAPERAVAAGTEYFVVGTTKLVLLYFATLGMYPLFWFYMHWARYKRFRRQDMWPAARALFAIFFTHQLTGEIDDRLRRDGKRHAWSPGGNATAFVVLSIISTVASRIPEGISRTADLLPILLLALLAWCLVHIQRAANLARGLAQGGPNRGLTWVKWIWLVLGGIFWLLILAGLLLPAEA